MRKRFFLIVSLQFGLLPFLFSSAGAQIYNGDLTLTTQTEVDAFNYTQVTGDLTIDDLIDGNITNLNGLSELTTVGGNLQIANNTALASNIIGLSNLNSIGGDLIIANNDALISVDGLSNLGSIGENLNISDNAALTNIDELDNLGFVGIGLSISGNASLTGVSLSNLTTVGALYIRNNAALTNIDGLSNLASVGTVVNGHLVIENNNVLADIDGLSSLGFIGYDLIITSNDALNNIDGLSNVNSIGGQLFMQYNQSLTSIDGLSGINSIGGVFVIQSHSSLININGLSNLSSVAGHFSLGSNAVLTDVNGLSNLGFVGGDLDILGNTSLSEFCGLYTLFSSGNIGGTTTISGNATNPTEQDIIDGGPCSALPVQFILFNVKCEGNKVIIKWKTAQEQNSSHFIVERSQDGLRWIGIGNLPAAGNSNIERSYSFIDNNAAQGGFYRIAQYDIDGRTEYTSILRSSCNARDIFKAWPNPFNETVFVNISANSGSETLIKIFDNKGALVKIQRATLLPGSNQINVDMKGLASGTYHLSAEWNNGQVKKTVQVIKQ